MKFTSIYSSISLALIALTFGLQRRSKALKLNPFNSWNQNKIAFDKMK